MGNLSSCTSSGRFNSVTPSSPPHALPPVARVLLVEGGALTFTFPIKVIKLLLDYPFHVICPLDSLRPGQHPLSSLLPDEELELGQLYLLLPLKTFENRQSMPSMAPLIRRNLDGNLPKLQVPLKNLEENRKILSMSSMPTRSYKSPYIEGDLPDNSPEKECGESAKLLSFGQKSEMGFADSDERNNNFYVGDSNFGKKLDIIAREKDPLREQVDDYRKNSQLGVGVSRSEKFHNNFDFNARENQKTKRLASMATFNTAVYKERAKFTHNSNNANNNDNNNNNNIEFCSRLCDTPELQMAYRSAMLRRCRSWTPRLQSITENKRIKSASYN